MIREVKVVTSGYAPEFGQTMGMVYNAITPSGTNTLQGPGQLSLAAPVDGRRCRSSRRPARRKPPTDVNVYTVRPRRPDRQGQDALLRRLRAHRARPVGPERDHDHAGEPGGARPDRARLHAARPEHRVRDRQDRSPAERRPTACRCATCSSTTSSPPTSAAACSSVQRANDFADRQHSTGAQLISTLGADHAERAARAVRDPRAEPRAERAVGHRPGDQHHRRRQLRRPDRAVSPTPASASRRTSSRSTTTSRC